ncbi:MAG: cupin fold metalloprotein, WbuC family [Rhodospirillales bacterium]|nr:MAG: cupin fold metalloprotein, WbuC family [Rhodospirillales bacterium]
MSLPMKFRKVNDEVYYTTESVTKVGWDVVAWLKEKASGNPRQRVRLCTHPDSDDLLHEMLIVHARNAYVRPHRHPTKSESFHMIEGELSVLIFSGDGSVQEHIGMSSQHPDRPFYYRLSKPLYHTVVPHSDFVVFHETTNGPFRREDMEFAPWSPAEDADPAAQQAYLANLFGGQTP